MFKTFRARAVFLFELGCDPPDQRLFGIEQREFGGRLAILLIQRRLAVVPHLIVPPGIGRNTCLDRFRSFLPNLLRKVRRIASEDSYARTIDDLRLHACPCRPSGRAHSSRLPSAPAVRRSGFIVYRGTSAKTLPGASHRDHGTCETLAA